MALRMSQAHDIPAPNEGSSGVKNVLEMVQDRRMAMDKAVAALHDRLGELTLPTRGTRGQGLLRNMGLKINDFYYKYLVDDRETFFDGESHLKDLTNIFDEAMDTVVKNWPVLNQAGYDWNTLCSNLHTTMRGIAGVWSLTDALDAHVASWFAKYRQDQKDAPAKAKLEAEYQKRDRLAQDAMRAHSELAYFSSIGRTDKSVIAQVRGRIALIDKELESLPVSKEEAPAFSKMTPGQRVILTSPVKRTPEPEPKKWWQFWRK